MTGILDAPVTAPAPNTEGTPPDGQGGIKEPVGQAVTGAIKEAADQAANAEFLGTLPEALRDIPAMKSIKGAGDLATQFVNQQALLGNSLRIPTEDTADDQRESFYRKLNEVPGVIRVPSEGADDAQMTEFYGKLGVPATPNEYNVQVPEGKTVDADFLQAATEQAHAMKLTNNQLNHLIGKEIEAGEAAQLAKLDYIDASKIALKAIWSSDYEARVAGATNAFNLYKQEMPEYADELAQFADNPIFVKLLSDVAVTMSEKGHAGMQSAANYGMTVDEAMMKRSEIMDNAKHPYFNGDQDSINYMLKLNEIIAGGAV